MMILRNIYVHTAILGALTNVVCIYRLRTCGAQSTVGIVESRSLVHPRSRSYIPSIPCLLLNNLVHSNTTQHLFPRQCFSPTKFLIVILIRAQDLVESTLTIPFVICARSCYI